MRDILFLAHRIPFPPNRGDKIRSFHLLRHLGRLARVHLACFADDRAEAGHLAALRDAMEGRLGDAHVEIRRSSLPRIASAFARGEALSPAMFDSPVMRRFVQEYIASRGVGTIFAFSGQMAQFVPDAFSGRFVMDFVDADSAKFDGYGRSGFGPRALLYRREGRRLLELERRIARRAAVSLFVSDAEAALFLKRVGGDDVNVASIGNGIDLAFYDPAAPFQRLGGEMPGSPLIVFTGQMNYRPNVEAVAAFSHDVMPRVLAAHPQACFAIVGRRPVKAVRRLDGRNGTIVTGAVHDVRTWLGAADVVVAPLRIGRGIQNKLLEAMAMAKPVVASSAAFTGIEAEPGCDLLVADGAAEQARAVNDILCDQALAGRLGSAARRRMLEAYRWDARLEPLAALIGQSRRQAAA